MATFASVCELNAFLASRSYVNGFKFSPEDVKVFSGLAAFPDAASHPHAYRWARHIAALTGHKIILAPAAPCTSAKKAAAPAPAAKADDFDDMFGEEEETKPAAKEVEIDDMFGDEDDGETAEEREANKARRARMEAALKLKEEKDAKAGKVKKNSEKPPEKSLIVLDVKPWEADTDLVALWHKIKEYEQDGLVWGETYKLEPVAYGINKLVMTVSIEDKKVLLDDITDNIEALEDFVQSVNVASMNKI